MTADLHDPSRVMLVIFGRRTADHGGKFHDIWYTWYARHLRILLWIINFSGTEFPGRDWLFLEIIRKEPITGVLTKCEAFLGVQRVLHWSVKYVPAFPPRKVCQDLALGLLQRSRKVNICFSRFFSLNCTTWPKKIRREMNTTKTKILGSYFRSEETSLVWLHFILLFSKSVSEKLPVTNYHVRKWGCEHF